MSTKQTLYSHASRLFVWLSALWAEGRVCVAMTNPDWDNKENSEDGKRTKNTPCHDVSRQIGIIKIIQISSALQRIVTPRPCNLQQLCYLVCRPGS